MAKLYFKYGAMGSSKSAQALITKFNYEELGMSVWLIKPSIDTRDGADVIRSRIGLEAHANIITPDDSIAAAYAEAGRHDVIIADEAQFFTPGQIDELRTLVDEQDIPVVLRGLHGEAALAAAQLQMEGLVARILRQPLALILHGFLHQHSGGPLHAGDQIRFFAHSHKLSHSILWHQ